MKAHIPITATLVLALTVGTSFAQPAGGLGTATGPSGGVVGAGGLNALPQPGNGLIANPGAANQSGGAVRYGTGASGNAPGATAPIGALPQGQIGATGQSPTVGAPAASPP